MSSRNLIWLAVIVLVAVVGSIVFDAVWIGIVLGVVALVASEVIERVRRRRIAAETGRDVPSVRRAITSNRKRR